MSRKRRRNLQIGIFFILVATGLGLASAILLKSIWAVIIILAVAVFDSYWFYVLYSQKKKPRYPLVPPEGKPDAFLPRTDIPRPIYLDARLMQEKKRRFVKLNKMRRKKKYDKEAS